MHVTQLTLHSHGYYTRSICMPSQRLKMAPQESAPYLMPVLMTQSRSHLSNCREASRKCKEDIFFRSQIQDVLIFKWLKLCISKFSVSFHMSGLSDVWPSDGLDQSNLGLSHVYGIRTSIFEALEWTFWTGLPRWPLRSQRNRAVYLSVQPGATTIKSLSSCIKCRLLGPISDNMIKV